MALQEVSQEFLSEINIANTPMTFTTPDGKIGNILFLSFGAEIKIMISVPKAQAPPQEQPQEQSQYVRIDPQPQRIRPQPRQAQVQTSHQQNAGGNVVPSPLFATPRSHTHQPAAQANVNSQTQQQVKQATDDRPNFRFEKKGTEWAIFDGATELNDSHYQHYNPSAADKNECRSFLSKKAANIMLYNRPGTSDYYIAFGDIWFKYNKH